MQSSGDRHQSAEQFPFGFSRHRVHFHLNFQTTIGNLARQLTNQIWYIKYLWSNYGGVGNLSQYSEADLVTSKRYYYWYCTGTDTHLPKALGTFHLPRYLPATLVMEGSNELSST